MEPGGPFLLLVSSTAKMITTPRPTHTQAATPNMRLPSTPEEALEPTTSGTERSSESISGSWGPEEISEEGSSEELSSLELSSELVCDTGTTGTEATDTVTGAVEETGTDEGGGAVSLGVGAGGSCAGGEFSGCCVG